MRIKSTLLILGFLMPLGLWGQGQALAGRVTDGVQAVAYAHIRVAETAVGTTSDTLGYFRLEGLRPGKHLLEITALGYRPGRVTVRLPRQAADLLVIPLSPQNETLDETVVTGTLKAVRRSDSPVPVEVYSPAFIRKNPTPNVFEALQLVNGIRPQINCNVCNTGDIHINGLEGPYTLVLIDGMPIVSGLGTVYGMSGIPNSLIEQVEIVKGPASSLYGSEAVGGLINIRTKDAVAAPELFADTFMTGWGEYNLDVGGHFRVGNKADVLSSVNFFNYSHPIDDNGDNFTDLTLQQRVSLFQKWQLERRESRLFSLAGRFFYEDRWGGEMQWTPEFRGGDSIYGESIETRRWELLGTYQLPFAEKMLFSFSYNDHHQNSVYGNVPYLADQRIGFGQLTWDKTAGTHDLLAGLALRYNFYDDNTPATAAGSENAPDAVWIPGVFVQDEWALAPAHSLLTGLRLDHHRRHGAILTPRLAYRWKSPRHDVVRVNAGTGFRVVNLFTEEHAALTGAREVVVAEALKPERSVNVNVNYLKKIYAPNGVFAGADFSVFYTYFNNRIQPDYDTDPNKIIYANLDGKSIAAGMSLNLDIAFPGGFKGGLGFTLQEVRTTQQGQTLRPVLTERYSGTWNLAYTFEKLHLSVDYTGNLYGPMRLPLLGDLDPRPAYSPVWSIQNIQFTYAGVPGLSLYAGIKNLLDWTPGRKGPFLIARADDPFDKRVVFDPQGNPVPTPDNPYALTFDPSYVYGPNQGLRLFAGLRYRLD